jgi:phage terminase small subunit
LYVIVLPVVIVVVIFFVLSYLYNTIIIAQADVSRQPFFNTFLYFCYNNHMPNTTEHNKPKRPKRPLTLKQRRFIDYYLQTGNATKSAKLAGYTTTKHSLEVIGSQNLRKVEVARAINTKLQAQKINPEYVLSGISTLADTSKRDSDKLRAYELLGKYLKLFTDVEESKPTEIILKLGELAPTLEQVISEQTTPTTSPTNTPQIGDNKQIV